LKPVRTDLTDPCVLAVFPEAAQVLEITQRRTT
jgi:hypothetical protein